MYPLQFEPVLQPRIWGGSKLARLLAKPVPAELYNQPIGESWELADLPPDTAGPDARGRQPDGSVSSIIANGEYKDRSINDLLQAHPGLLGPAAPVRGRFPLLIKFLDARTDLSVQVHPDAAYAARHPGAQLKSEAWFIMQAEPGAKIYKGLKPGVTAADFTAALDAGDVAPLLNVIPVKTGDCHYLPSGTVHALGAGILAAEVQTPSDTTFRVFDWNRLGPDGQPRKLHVGQALECIQFGPSDSDAAPAADGSDKTQFSTAETRGARRRLVSCDFFTLDHITADARLRQMLSPAEPVVWMVLAGQGVIECADAGPTAFAPGQTLLLPANMREARVKTVTDAAWLEAKLPAKSVE
jgi:mannose-6-phosphate isomerase